MPTTSPGFETSLTPDVRPIIDPGIQINTGTYSQASAISIGGVTDPIDGPIPETGTPFSIQLSRPLPDIDPAGGDPIGMGFSVDHASRDGKKVVNVRGYGLEKRLHQTQINTSFENTPAGEIIRYACDQAGVSRLPEAFPAPSDVPDENAERLLRTDRNNRTNMTVSYTDTPAISVIDEVCRRASYEWRIYNSALFYGRQEALIQFRQSDEDNNRAQELGLLTGPRTHQLRWILPDNTDPRQTAYRFDIIRVVGNPRRTETNGVVVENDSLIAEINTGTGGELPTNPRVHVYEDDRITTQQQANNTAQLLWKEIEKQSQSGPIRCVGDPRPHPLDRVVLPDFLGGGNRLVVSTLHVIDSNGWITEITTGGQPDLSNMPEIRTTRTQNATPTNDPGGEE